MGKQIHMENHVYLLHTSLSFLSVSAWGFFSYFLMLQSLILYHRRQRASVQKRSCVGDGMGVFTVI